VSEDRAQPIGCASYTHARRHPMVLGSIGGWSPPFQVTMTQLGVLLASVLVINKSWYLWGPLFPPIVSVLIALAVPSLAAWAARRVKVEGRSPGRAALGWLSLMCAPHDGTVGGHPAREPGAVSFGAGRTWLAPAPGGERQ
jgi:hypothetical protein